MRAQPRLPSCNARRCVLTLQLCGTVLLLLVCAARHIAVSRRGNFGAGFDRIAAVALPRVFDPSSRHISVGARLGAVFEREDVTGRCGVHWEHAMHDIVVHIALELVDRAAGRGRHENAAK